MNFINGLIHNHKELSFISSDTNIKINLPAKYKKTLDKYINQKVVLGIRPEHIVLKSSDEFSLHKQLCSISVAEQMGNETILYFNLGGAEFIARVSAIEKPNAGDQFPLFFKLDNLHFYDSDSGEAIH
jgi:multiple sugar transport system ATP-binding protein